MNKQAQLMRAISIANTTHYNQYDKGGNPYILHPLHLMNQLLFDKELAAIAVLHDVIEDGYISCVDLKDIGFSERVIIALDLLTHKPEDSYEEYINNMRFNIDAIRVKRKDLEHNSDITRLKGVTPKDLKRIEKYHRAFIKLGEFRDNLIGE